MNEMESLDKVYVMSPAYRNEVLTKTNESLKKKKKKINTHQIFFTSSDTCLSSKYI